MRKVIIFSFAFFITIGLSWAADNNNQPSQNYSAYDFNRPYLSYLTTQVTMENYNYMNSLNNIGQYPVPSYMYQTPNLPSQALYPPNYQQTGLDTLYQTSDISSYHQLNLDLLNQVSPSQTNSSVLDQKRDDELKYKSPSDSIQPSTH